jgi:hypothetical protein
VEEVSISGKEVSISGGRRLGRGGGVDGMARRAGVARRRGMPVLDFFFLVYREGDSWLGRSVRTGHVSESGTFPGAVRNLMRAIDIEIEMAAADGIAVQDWYDSQQPDDPKFVRMFFDAIARKNPDRKRSPTHGGDAVLRAVVAKAA